jgi:hypothetical protein
VELRQRKEVFMLKENELWEIRDKVKIAIDPGTLMPGIEEGVCES